MNMDNPFKQLTEPPKDTPLDLEQKVMGDVALSQLFVDTANLVSFNYAQVVERFLENKNQPNK